MTFVLRSRSGDVELGGTRQLLSAFSEMARLEPTGERYAELLAVPLTSENTLPAAYLRSVGEQAERFLREHSQNLSAHARWVLGRLARTGEKTSAFAEMIAQASEATRVAYADSLSVAERRRMLERIADQDRAAAGEVAGYLEMLSLLENALVQRNDED